MEIIILILFCTGLLICVIFGFSVLWALAVGLVLFMFYGKYKGFSWNELMKISIEGVRTVKNILITFLLIGIMTAFWRASGTIPAIVSYSSELMSPSFFLLLTFLLNCGMSVLTGTSFGTAATMGAVCMTMARAMNIDTRIVGGAVLSGVYFGDRCSPVSTSALLVSELTDTDIFDNIKAMLRSAFVPFLLSCVIYGFLGFFTANTGEVPNMYDFFSGEFVLHRMTFAPAVVLLLFSVMRADVKTTMAASILTAALLCLFLQHTTPFELLRTSVAGFSAADEEMGVMMNGGGIISMMKVAGVVCLSSAYSGIFQRTGLLDGLKQIIGNIAERMTPYAAMLVTSVAANIIACNQSLAIIMTKQLCNNIYNDKYCLAIDMEDSAVVTAPLVPWSIAGCVPLASAGAPMISMAFACYLYMIPLWRTLHSFYKK